MLVAVTLIAFFATLLAVYYRIQLYQMRMRAAYWENEMRRDSMIRHHYLQEMQPNTFSPGISFKTKAS